MLSECKGGKAASAFLQQIVHNINNRIISILSGAVDHLQPTQVQVLLVLLTSLRQTQLLQVLQLGELGVGIATAFCLLGSLLLDDLQVFD